MSETRWISVQERLPEEDESVLFRTEKGFVSTGSYAEKLWYYDGDLKWHPIVTHWKPLPDPPESAR